MIFAYVPHMSHWSSACSPIVCRSNPGCSPCCPRLRHLRGVASGCPAEHGDLREEQRPTQRWGAECAAISGRNLWALERTPSVYKSLTKQYFLGHITNNIYCHRKLFEQKQWFN
jgi:hypothetical protein